MAWFSSLTTVLLLYAFLAHGGNAQAQPPSLKVRLAPELQHSLLPLALDATSQALLSQQQRGHRLRAFGIALAVVGVAHAVVFGRKGSLCYEQDERIASAPFVGGFVTALGVSLAIGGAIKLRNLPAGYREAHPRSRGRVAGLVLGTLALAALTSGHLVALAMPEFAICASS